ERIACHFACQRVNFVAKSKEEKRDKHHIFLRRSGGVGRRVFRMVKAQKQKKRPQALFRR
ncbi:hypothetical protein ORL26_25705, partial [Raoultella ornithinolytica]|uniref:hypothetical protein n=1 Tax=Raoultella ornithinolytica TaxID=54291 RepID=UPI0022466C23